MENIVIIGTGGMAKEIWGLCCLSYNVLGFVAERAGYIDTFMGLPILAEDTEFLMKGHHKCVIANGTPDIRRKIAGKYMESAHSLPSVIHPGAHIFGNVDISLWGVTVMPGGVIQPDVRIEDFVHLNMGVTIGHDVSIGQFSVVNHNAGISGNVRIGEACPHRRSLLDRCRGHHHRGEYNRRWRYRRSRSGNHQRRSGRRNLGGHPGATAKKKS
jgi:acetyltransferase-like isoleucine patch superfamily enzyme